jgi:CRP-like cAMP-binding protein
MVVVAMRERLLAPVRSHPILASLDEAWIVAHGSMLSLRRGAPLYVSGKAANAVYFVLRGALQIEYPERGASRGRVIAIVMAPGVIGECQTLYRTRWTGTGVALTDLDLFVLEREALLRMLVSTPRVAALLYCELAWQFLGAIERRRLEPDQDPAARLSNYLVDLHRATAEQDPSFSGWIPVIQSELGRACGLRRETVLRVFTDWRRKKLIESRRGQVRLAEALFVPKRTSLIARMNGLEALPPT